MRIEIFKDQAGDWRWRIKAGNHAIVADSGEGYVERRSAVRTVARLLRLPLPKRPRGASAQHQYGSGERYLIRYGSGGKVTYGQWAVGGVIYELVEVTS